jgi:glycosyltransferase involved in cell wall biosynthesis
MATPIVSIVTVTKERERFFPHLIRTIENQDIGIDNIEWVIVDEGSVPIFNYVRDLPFISYFFKPGFKALGTKRNFANHLARGDYIAYFDDDNYAFPSRLRASVNFLNTHRQFDIVGSSEMYVFDNQIKQAYITGPFGESHATLGTWCIRRRLLETTIFDDNAKSGEEVSFSRNWTIPIGQIAKENTSVCFDHGSNTISKQHLLRDATRFMPLSQIISDRYSVEFFENYQL